MWGGFCGGGGGGDSEEIAIREEFEMGRGKIGVEQGNRGNRKIRRFAEVGGGGEVRGWTEGLEMEDRRGR